MYSSRHVGFVDYKYPAEQRHNRDPFNIKRSVREESIWSRLVKNIVKTGKDFCLSTNMHGFNHIAAPRRLLIERTLWLAITALAIWGALDISMGQLQRYNENPTVVTLEKDFRTWRYGLPAIMHCQANKVDEKKAPDVIKKLWHKSPGDEKYDYYLKFVHTVANSDLMNLANFSEFAHDETLHVDMYELAYSVLPAQLVKAAWAESLKVSPRWTPVMTEFGVCFVTNCVAIQDFAIEPPDANDTKLLPITCKYSDFSCYVIIESYSNASFMFHSPYDVYDVTTTINFIELTLNRKIELSVLETRCGEGVRQLDVSRRGCIYGDEPTSSGNKVYSANLCRRSCRNSFAIEKCGCKPFYNKYEPGKTCTPGGMACLSRLRHDFIGVKCSCMLQCVDMVFKEISRDDQYWDKGIFVNRGSITYSVQAPKTRYTREIVFYFQDLVVSFGGAAGLFLGASFLSFIEILYFLVEKCIRAFARKKVQGKLDTQKRETKPATSQTSTIPYETARIMELTKIIENSEQRNSYGFRMY